MDVHVFAADWNTHREVLQSIRGAVFIEEQGVPKALEWDGEDAGARHFLAVTAAGQRIGCARLLHDGQIGRMAVLRSHRGQGVGKKLLEACVDAATEQGLGKVFLHAQVHAEPFYRKHGFLPVGDEYLEAGIPHRSMERVLPIPFEATPNLERPDVRAQAPDPAATDNALRAFRGEADCVAGLAEMLAWPRRQVRIYSQTLDHTLFDRPEVVAALSAFVREGRPARIQILVHSSGAIVSRGHRLVELARRLDSKIALRTVPGELASDRHSCVIGDEASYFLLPDHEEYQAFANRYDPVQAARLAERFDYLWERGRSDPELRTLRL